MQFTSSQDALRIFELTSVYTAMNHFVDSEIGDIRTRNLKKKNAAWARFLVNDFYPALIRSQCLCCHVKISDVTSPQFQRTLRESLQYTVPYLKDSIQLITSHLEKPGNKIRGYSEQLSGIRNSLQEKLKLYGEVLSANPSQLNFRECA